MNGHKITVDHAVILAGGLGTRLATVSSGIPKALVAVGGEPFLNHKIRELETNNIKRLTLLTHHGSEGIKRYVKSQHFNLDISFVDDGPTALGTGGALAAALSSLPEHFFLTYGDNLLLLDYQSLASSVYWADNRSVLAVTKEVGPADRFNSSYVKGVITHHDKDTERAMNCLDYGLILFHKEHVKRIAADFQDVKYGLDLLLNHLAEQRLLAGFLTQEPYYEIGTPQTLALTAAWLEGSDH